MIIGFDASRAFINKRTGTENYSYQLLKHLAQIDHKNHYYIFLRPENNSENSERLRSQNIREPEDQKVRKSGIPVSDTLILSGVPSHSESFRNWPSNFRFILLNQPRLWTQFGLAKQTFIDKMDLLFVSSHTLPLIRRPGLKTILTVHDLGAEYLPTMHQLKQRAYLKLITDYQLKSATHLIAVSQATKQDLVKKAGINPQKITVVYEGFNEKLFQPVQVDPQNHLFKQLDIVPGNYLLFVGTIQPRKNLERLIKAYALFLSESQKVRKSGIPVSDTRILSGVPSHSESFRNKTSNPPKLILVGNKGWLSEEIYELPKKLGIENQVRFLGYVPDEQLPILYSEALAFVFPSLFEGFGLPILEAMACGCPVLTSNISSLPEVAGQAAILVNPQSEEDIVNALIKITTSQKLRSRLTKLGFAQVKKFSWEKCAQKTLLVLEKVDKKA